MWLYNPVVLLDLFRWFCCWIYRMTQSNTTYVFILAPIGCLAWSALPVLSSTAGCPQHRIANNSYLIHIPLPHALLHGSPLDEHVFP